MADNITKRARGKNTEELLPFFNECLMEERQQHPDGFSFEEKLQWRLTSGNPKGENIIHIPIRSGSTRIADKNIRKINGLPLLAYTILLAKRLKGIDRVIVNTDSEKYARIAEEFGAEAPFLRPKSLSHEKSCLWDANKFLLNYRAWVEKGINGKVVTMLATNPFRHLERTQKMIDEMDHCSHFIAGFSPSVQFERLCAANGKTFMLFPDSPTEPFPVNFFKMCNLTAMNSYYKTVVGKKIIYRLISNPIELIDVDTESDLTTVENIMKNDLYDFGTDLC